MTILATVAFVAIAFALVYSPWPKSKEYREQEAIAKRHYQKALDARRLDVAFHASHIVAVQDLQEKVINAAAEFYANRAVLSAHKHNAEMQTRLAQFGTARSRSET